MRFICGAVYVGVGAAFVNGVWNSAAVLPYPLAIALVVVGAAAPLAGYAIGRYWAPAVVVRRARGEWCG